MPPQIVFILSRNHLSEGGRSRHPLEANLTLNTAQREFFGGRVIPIRTSDGDVFPAPLSGNCGKDRPGTYKNLRSLPATSLGAFLKERCGALPGDRIYVTALDDGSFLFDFQRAERVTQLPVRAHRAA